MKKSIILQDKNKNHRLRVLISSILMVLFSLFIIFINQKSDQHLKQSTIDMYQNFQLIETKNIVSSFNEVKDTLSKSNDKRTNSLYEEMLIAKSRYTKIGNNGITLLLDQEYNYLYRSETLDGIGRSKDFIDLSTNPQRYSIDTQSETFLTCFNGMKKNHEDGRCKIINGKDIEYYYWHKIPSLGSTMNGKTYFLIFGFKENDALYNYSNIQIVNKISLTIQSLLLVISLFISIWATTNLSYYRKKLKIYEIDN